MKQRNEIAKLYELSGLSDTKLSRNINSAYGASSYFSILMTGLIMPLHEYLASTIYNCYTYRWVIFIIIILPNKIRENMYDYFQISKLMIKLLNFIFKINLYFLLTFRIWYEYVKICEK